MTNEEFVHQISDAEKSLYRVAKSVLKNDADCADAIQETVFALGSDREKQWGICWHTRL